jgi:hypothetical protein
MFGLHFWFLGAFPAQKRRKPGFTGLRALALRPRRKRRVCSAPLQSLSLRDSSFFLLLFPFILHRAVKMSGGSGKAFL